MCHPVPTKALHAAFLSILPRIETHGHIYFRDLKDLQRREELVSEMVAICWRWFVRLAQNGRDGTEFPSALASFAARAVKSGRRLCGHERAQDALSPFAQQLHGFTTGRLSEAGAFTDSPLAEALCDNTRSSPPDAVAFRCDFPAWLLRLSQRDHRMIHDLMQGERTRDVARKFGLSAARVSQLRREFHADWQRFCGEAPAEQRPTASNAA
jgi:hypothetical protein